MTQTILSLVSILLGILGAVLIGLLKPKWSFGLTGNIIVGVFASIFIIKSFGRLGFAPNDIVINQQVNYFLLILNLIISLISGALALTLTHYIKQKLP